MSPARGRQPRPVLSTTPAHIAKGAPGRARARPALPVGSLRSWPRWSSRAALLLVSPHICERDLPDACQCRRRSALVLRGRLRPAPDTDSFRFPRRLVPLAVLPSSPSIRALLEHDCVTARSAASQFFVSRPPPGAVLRHEPLDVVLPAPSARLTDDRQRRGAHVRQDQGAVSRHCPSFSVPPYIFNCELLAKMKMPCLLHSVMS